MQSWDITELDLEPHAPQIISSTPDGRAIALLIPAGASLSDHQVHEGAWLSLLAGEADITTAGGERISARPGMVVEFDPGERHAVRARSDTRLLLLLTPWPGDGHPGSLSLEDRANARERAAQRRAEHPN